MATVLILDASPTSRRFFAEQLGKHGHKVLHLSDAEEALSLVRLERPDLAVVDIDAPDLDGCKFVMRTRCQPDISRPRVVMRAVAGMEAEVRALAHAFGAAFIVKPTNPEQLLSLVNSALSEPRPPDPGTGLDSQVPDVLMQPIVRLTRRVAERSVQLEVARNALDLEIRKRIWAEQELMHANLRLRDQAMRDAVTGLHNRRFLEESLDYQETRVKRVGQGLAILMIDIDHFKEFNDTLGHAAGDAILRSVGECMLAVSRAEDIVARYGGDEFALMMANTSQETAWRRAELIRERVHKLGVRDNGSEFGPVTLSVGIAVLPDNGATAGEVLRAADEALLTSKQTGRNRVVLSLTRAHPGAAQASLAAEPAAPELAPLETS